MQSMTSPAYHDAGHVSRGHVAIRAWLFRYRWHLFGGLVFLLLLMSFKVLILVPLIGANIAASWFIKKVKVSWLGFEVVLLSTVFAGAAFGSVAGVIMGVLCILIFYVVSRKNLKYFFITVPLYAFIGFISSSIPLEHFVGWGIVITLLYNVVSFLVSKAAGARTSSIILFVVTNILFNISFFTRFGPLLVSYVS